MRCAVRRKSDRLTGNIVPKDDIKQSHHARHRAPLFHKMSDYNLTSRSSWNTTSARTLPRSKIYLEEYVEFLFVLAHTHTRILKIKY